MAKINYNGTKKTININVGTDDWAEFVKICHGQDISASQGVRKLIRGVIRKRRARSGGE